MARLFLCLLLVLAPASAWAQVTGTSDRAVPASTRLADLSEDELFARLAGTEPDSGYGKRLEREILRRFHHSGSDTADLLFARALEALEAEDRALSLDLLDEVILLKPDFAEAWNKRATIYFLQRDFGSSIADIRETLAREPRHFGALAGLGMILNSLDRKEEALRALHRAIDLNPQLDSVRETVEDLEKELAGRAI
jgi:tetratricopeptide (TPR) repeat protein